ncbi:MAG TPA: OB-fold domain-containing protein [Mycobacteriales bacterium]|nr:OB-fold domain-containing protein [Mycobacteriales bacterium]
MTRPVPVPDAVSQAYWDAAAKHVLTVARCAACAKLTVPPDVVCPHCGSGEPAWEFVPVSGTGSVRSWTVMRQSFLPGFGDDVPFVLVDVELAEQPELRLIGRLLDGAGADLHIGAAVAVAFEDIAEGIAVPAFTLSDRACSQAPGAPSASAP